MAPLVCAKCSCPLFEPSATGVCARCASAPGTTGPIVRSAPNTPQGFRDGTAPGTDPNPFAPTHTGPFEAPTADPPPGAPGAAPRPLPLSPPGYQIKKWIGGGGMGDVYSAEELASNRLVALKFMHHPSDPGLFGRFVDEFGVLANLEHPHVVRVFGHDFHRADPYFTMELMDGGSLAIRLKTDPLEAADAVELIRKVAAGVQALHELRCHGNLDKPVIHRDIKPSNILLTAAGEPKLADFGLVKYLGASAVHTLPGDIVGTAQYMPPEQINRANGALDVRADVYGLGATLYHLLTGYAPFNGETVPEILHSVLVDPPVRPRVLRPEITRGLESVVLKCLEKDPRDRYQSVAEFVAALDLWAARDVPEPRPLAQRARHLVRDHKRAVAAVVLGLALVGVWVALTWLAPADPIEDEKKKLQAGHPATVVKDKGPPIYQRVLLEPSRVGDSPLGDGRCALNSFETCLLELWTDSQTDTYKVTIDLQHLRPLALGLVETDYIGVYFGYSSAQVEGETCHGMFAVTFEDYRATAPDGKRAVWLRRLGFSQDGKSWAKEDSGKPAGLKFVPSPTRPGPWRRICFTMTTTEVRVEWYPNPDHEPNKSEVLVCWTHEECKAQYARLQGKLAERQRAAHALPQWSPRMPFGVVSHRSSVAIRNVVITPLQKGPIDAR